MKTIRLFGLIMLTALVFSSCSKSDDDRQPKNRKWVFTLDGKSAHAGDTIHVLHTDFAKTIKWQDENDPINPDNPDSNQYDTYMEIYSGGATYIQDSWFLLSFFSYPSLSRFILHDYSSEPSRDYDIYVDVQPIDLVGKIDIKGTIPGYYDNVYHNNKYIEGPFLIFYIDEELRKIFITNEPAGTSISGTSMVHDVAKSFFRIKAFGSNRETCYPSYSDWGWFTEMKTVGNHGESNGECFYGKITTSNVNYWFVKFDYGDYSYEVRKYKNSNTCLWNGEWDK
ncbi:hypothetical protein [Prevotella sp. MA2016]|uniref:hypothetical protein n=1 Tax=Prevotella sp. MA2016 TaxID=1408310 RepID=UPI00048C6A5D|nr:hypothetical protein [Prevotella sp. MA2016]